METQGLSSQYRLSLGSNYPILTDWTNACAPGSHNAPYGVAVDSSGVYIAANASENIETCTLKLTLDGATRLWGEPIGKYSFDGAQSLAVEGNELFMLGHINPKSIHVYNATKGGITRNIDVRWDAASDPSDDADMDIKGSVLVVAYTAKNAIRWYNPATGALIDTATVKTPAGVSVAADGTVYVSSGSTIYHLTQADHSLVPLSLDLNLSRPGHLDIDHSTGNLLVYQWGTNQILRLNTSGSVLQTYGVSGGRQLGLYTNTTRKSFAGFSDLCADGAGGFYVTESCAAPRRTAHFNSAGEVTQEWYGGQHWGPHATPDPDDPNVMWVISNWGGIMRVTVDYNANTWKVHSTYEYTGMADGLIDDSWSEGGLCTIYKHNGVKYLVFSTVPTMLKIDEKNWKLIPVTASHVIWDGTPQFMKDWAAAAGCGKGSYQWNDANGDGLPQKSEVIFYKTTSFWPEFSPTVDGNFTFFGTYNINGQYKVKSFPVTSWNSVGAPIYGTLGNGTVYADCPVRFRNDLRESPAWASYLYNDIAGGHLYGAFNPGTVSWCTSTDSFLQQWDSTGKPTWGVSEQGYNPGQINHNLRSFAGIVHNCVVVTDVNGGWTSGMTADGNFYAHSYIWDPDGLYVGGIMDNPDLNGIPNYMPGLRNVRYIPCGAGCSYSSLMPL